jgi:hypothetical protein
MNVDPRQNDPQFQSPTVGDSQQASQFGMGGQADVPSQRGGAQGSTPGMRNIDPNTIRPGTDVFGTDGKRLGTVQEVYDDSFLVQKGIFFVHDYFIPFSIVTQVAADRIHLGMTADEAKSQDWSRRPGLASIGRDAQADRTTDTRQSTLNTRNNVNPSGTGADAGANPYASPALSPDATGGMRAPNPPDQQPSHGTQPSASTPIQQQAPASSAQGRAASADATQRATERGMQGTDSPNQDAMSANPQDPRRLNRTDPTQQGTTTP